MQQRLVQVVRSILPRGLAICVCLVLVARCLPGHADPALVLDFERPGLGDDWSAGRGITASRVAAPDVPAGAADGPTGMALSVTANKSSGLFLRTGKGPADWSRCSGVSFWIYRSGERNEPKAPATIEVQVYEKDGRARFWRKVDLGHTGWKRVELPLKWFRWGSGRVPRWEDAGRLGFWFRDNAEVVIDSIEVQRGAGLRPAELTLSDVHAVAFPGKQPEEVTAVETADVRLLTDAPDLDARQLADHLTKVAGRVQKDLSLEKPSIAPIFVIFATDEAYRGFPARLAEKLNSAAAVPSSSGYTLHGISTSAWDKQFGTLRPVYTHEYVHGLVARSVGVQNSGEWLQEGLANYYQIQFHPQKSLPEIIRTGVARPDHHSSLEQLCSGKPIPGNRYWQALTVIDLLLHDAKYSPRFPELVAAMGKDDATDLGPYLKTFWSTDWNQLTADWTRYCNATYAK